MSPYGNINISGSGTINKLYVNPFGQLKFIAVYKYRMFTYSEGGRQWQWYRHCLLRSIKILVCKPASAANKFYSKFTCPKGKEEAGSGGTTATKIYLPEGDKFIYCIKIPKFTCLGSWQDIYIRY